MTDVILDGDSLTIEKLVDVARNGAKVSLHPDAEARIIKCRNMLEEKIQAHEIMYGVNTGIGEFSEVVLDDDQVKEFQKYLIYNHAAGIGGPCLWIMYVELCWVGLLCIHMVIPVFDWR